MWHRAVSTDASCIILLGNNMTWCRDRLCDSRRQDHPTRTVLARVTTLLTNSWLKCAFTADWSWKSGAHRWKEAALVNAKEKTLVSEGRWRGRWLGRRTDACLRTSASTLRGCWSITLVDLSAQNLIRCIMRATSGENDLALFFSFSHWFSYPGRLYAGLSSLQKQVK